MIQIKHVPLEKISPPDFDQRLTESPQDDNELMESIRELGVLEPILVKRLKDGFEVIAGNRRFTQAGRAGLAAVPCIVIKSTGAAADKIALHENIHRLPLSHVDQAYTFAHLIKKYDMTETQVGIVVGRSVSYVSQHLSLLQCEETLVQAVQDGRINFSVARELMQCKDPDERNRFANIVEENGATSQVVQNWVRESNRATDSVGHQVDTNKTYDRPSDQAAPLYPCSACNVPIPVAEIKYVRLCPECNFLIFSDIERAKQEARLKNAPAKPPV